MLVPYSMYNVLKSRCNVAATQYLSFLNITVQDATLFFLSLVVIIYDVRGEVLKFLQS